MRSAGRVASFAAVLAAGALLLAGAGRVALLRPAAPGTATVARAPLAFRVKAQGTLESADRVVVSPPTIRDQWNFSIVFLAPEGKPTAAGAPVVGFDGRRQQEQLEVQVAELAAARKELEKVSLEEQERLDQLRLEQADVEARLSKLQRKIDLPEDLLARRELERNRLEAEEARRQHDLNVERLALQERTVAAKVEAATSKVARLEARVATTRDALQRLTVPAARAGFVVHVPDWNNKKQIVGNTVWAGQPIVEIADLTKMQVAAVVPEPEAGKVRAGQPVEIRLDANPDRLFRGRVAALGRVFRTKSWDKPSIVFDATIAIDDPDPELMRPGMAAEVTILAVTELPVLQLPEAAVRFGPGGPSVRVRDAAGGERTVPVTLGRRANDTVELLDGAAAGDVVVLPGAAG